MLWSGLIHIIKIIKLDSTYLLYIDQNKSVESLKNLSQYYKIVNDTEIILDVKLNPLMLCNYYDKFKIKTTKKFIDIDFSNSNIFIKLDINDNIRIYVKTMTKTETQINNKVYGETKRINIETKRINIETNKSVRKRFVSDLIDICKKINN